MFVLAPATILASFCTIHNTLLYMTYSIHVLAYYSTVCRLAVLYFVLHSLHHKFGGGVFSRLAISNHKSDEIM